MYLVHRTDSVNCREGLPESMVPACGGAAAFLVRRDGLHSSRGTGRITGNAAMPALRFPPSAACPLPRIRPGRLDIPPLPRDIL